MSELFENFSKLIEDTFNSDEMKSFFNEVNKDNSYYKKEKWVNGKLVSKDEVEYKNGEQVKDEHFDCNKCVENKTDVCENDEQKNHCDCKCSDKDKEIAELKKCINEDEKIYKELQSKYDVLKKNYDELLSRYERMQTKMNKIKNFFVGE